MHAHIRKFAPWFPWPLIGTAAAAQTVGVLPTLPNLLVCGTVGLAVTCTVITEAKRRLAAAAHRAAVNEAITRGYELAAELVYIGRVGGQLQRAVGETTTSGIPVLRSVAAGTTYRSVGDPATAPIQLDDRRPPSPRRSGRHRNH